MKRLILIIFILPAVLWIAGCETEIVSPVNEVNYASKLSEERVLVQSIELDGISEEAIQNAVLRATRNRGWEVTDLGSDGILAELVHRSHESKLTFEYGDSWVKIYSVSYKIDKDTQNRIERDEPEGWIRNLHKDILEILDRLPT